MTYCMCDAGVVCVAHGHKATVAFFITIPAPVFSVRSEKHHGGLEVEDRRTIAEIRGETGA